MLYIALIIFPSILGGKLIATPYGNLSAASLMSPFWFMLGDVIAEVYGYKLSIRLFISAIIVEIIMALISYGLIHLSSPNTWHHQEAYNLIIGELPRIFFFQILGVFIAWIMNAFFITRWKYLLHGKYFWIRSLGSTGIGETLFTVFSVTLTLIGTLSLHNITAIVLWSVTIKLLFTALFVGPLTFIIRLLKNIEGIDIYDNCYGYNPFSVKSELPGHPNENLHQHLREQ